MAGKFIDREDLWKDKARSLQIRLSDRFRVVVDRHRRRPRLPDGYFSSTLQRWLHHFRGDSLPSSSSFYRKPVSQDIDAEEVPVFTRMLQTLAVPVLGSVCHVFMHGLNRVHIYGAEKLQHALLHRPENKPLITVSNHVASMDDPLVIASLLPRSVLLNADSLRWTLCASDRCFQNPVTSAFFRCVKVLPVSRGDGIYQKGMDMAITKLNHGGWVHIFPEGSRSRDGGRTMGSAKRGVGRLVLDADTIPMVVPFVHSGMQEIMPIGAKFPRIGKTVTVVIGDPIHLDDLLNMEENQNIPRQNLYDAVSSRIGERLQELKVQVDRLAIEQSLQSQNYPQRSKRAANILQQIDWESLGMHSYIDSEDDSLSPRNDLWAEPKINLTHQEESDTPDRYFRMGFSYDSGIMSRIRGCMDSTELMGFAARGLYVNIRGKENFSTYQGVWPLKAWNKFLVSAHWNSC